MRRKTIAQVMLAVAVSAASSDALAQRRRGRGNRPAQTQPAAGGNTAAPAGGDSGSMTFTTDEASQPPAGTDTTAPAGGDTTAPGGTGGGGLEGIGGNDVRATRHPLTENIYAVQQIYALRNRRLEIQPTIGASLNDPYVSHTSAGVALNYWVSNVLAVGLNFNWFQGLNSQTDVNFHIARSAGLVVPINEYQMEAALNFSYVPVYGKFLMFNRFIFHWDMYLLAGVGFMRTRPIPVVDPEVRSFDYNFRLMFDAGLGLRVFVSRWFGIFGEVRNYVFPEQLENLTIQARDVPVAPGQRFTPMSRQDPSFWNGDTRLTDNVMVQFGITVFLPFGVNYRLLK